MAATTLTLTGPILGNSYGPQSASNPCVIAGTACSGDTAQVGYNNFQQKGNISTYDAYSTTPTAELANGVQGTPYVLSNLVNQIHGNVFDIAIDVNTADHQERLLSFDVLVNGVVQYTYNGGANGTLIGNIANNGNGYADYLLQTIDLSKFAGDSAILFHAMWNNASDGAESFFITNAKMVEMPIPPALALFGAGLAGIGLLKRVAKKKNANLTMA